MDIIVYIIIGGVGLLLALLTFIFDEILDGVLSIFDASLPDGAISGTTIAGTLSGFGFAGAAAIAFGVDSALITAIIASVTAIITWFIAWGVYKSLHSSSTKSGADSISNYVGLTGSVISAPADVDSWGQMTLNTRGYTQTLYFRSAETTKIGDAVKVTTVMDSARVMATPVNTQ